MFKVALTGTHGTGKSFIVDRLVEEFTDRGYKVGRIESPTRYLKSLGLRNNEDGQWETQLFSAVLRCIRQMEQDQEGLDLLIGDRCVVDELAYTKYLLFNSTGDEYNDLAQTMHLTEQMINVFVKDFWDVVAYKPLHPDFLPEEDGDRSGEAQFQIDVQDYLLESLHHEEVDFSTLDQDRVTAYNEMVRLVEEGLKK